MGHAESQPRRLAARCNGVVVDVEGVRSVGVIVDSDVADIDQTSQRQVIGVAQLPLLASGSGPFRQRADLGPVGRASLAVVGATPKGVDQPSAGGYRRRDSVEIARDVAADRTVLEPLVNAGQAHVKGAIRRAKIVAAGDGKRVVVLAGCANLVVAVVGHAELDRAVVVEAAEAQDICVPKLGSMVSVVTGRPVGVARSIARRVLELSAQAVDGRRLVADRIAQTGIEAALALGQRSLRPHRGSRKYRCRQRRRVAEYGMDVVVGREEFAELDRSPLALQAEKRLAGSQRRAPGVCLNGGLKLIDGIPTAAYVFGATQPKARRIAADAVDRRVRAVALPAADQLPIEIEAAVELEIGELRVRRRGRRGTGDGEHQRGQTAVDRASPQVIRAAYAPLATAHRRDRDIHRMYRGAVARPRRDTR